MTREIYPTYTITNSGNLLKIDVAPQLSFDYQNLILEEAAKSSLFGMAYIQKLAEKDTLAKDIKTIYQAYKSYFKTRNKEAFLKVLKEILDHSHHHLSKEMAIYLQNVLEEKPVVESQGSKLITYLIPFINETLSLTPPKVIIPEQKVQIPEMKMAHNAFPDLVKYHGEYYVAFREASSHVAYKDLGKIRIVKAILDSDNKIWHFENVALLSSDKYDFRDPKFFIDGEDQLHVIMDGSLINEEDETIMMVPHVAKYVDGSFEVTKAIVDPETAGKKGQWLWRVTWNPYDNKGYVFSYDKDENIYLMQTEDGVHFHKISTITNEKLPKDHLNETTIRFKEDGTLIALIRTTRNGLIAVSKPDSGYTSFDISLVPFRLGGPNFVIAKDDKMWAGTRYLFLNEDNTIDEAMVVAFMTNNKLIPLLKLNSFGDSSYPGMVLEEDGSITIVYYSSSEETKENEEKSDIYITRILPPN